MNTITVTVDLNEGNQAYFKIEFKNEDFIKVVDAVGDLTLESVQNNPLWTIV